MVLGRSLGRVPGGGGELAGVAARALEPKVWVPLDAADLSAGAELEALRAKRRASLGPLRRLGGLVPLTLECSPAAARTARSLGLGSAWEPLGGGSQLAVLAAAAAATAPSAASDTKASVTSTVTASRVPRRVEVERRKRANLAAHAELPQLLLRAGVPLDLGLAAPPSDSEWRDAGADEADGGTAPSPSASGEPGAQGQPPEGGVSAQLSAALATLGLTAILPSALPLHAFDDGERELRSPRSWVALGTRSSAAAAPAAAPQPSGAPEQQQQHGVPGQALDVWATATQPLPPPRSASSPRSSEPCASGVAASAAATSFEWRACRAVDYDAAVDEFIVLWTQPRRHGLGLPPPAQHHVLLPAATPHRPLVEPPPVAAALPPAAAATAADPPRRACGTRVVLPPLDVPTFGWASLPRLRLCFYAEDPVAFAARLAAAWTARQRAALALSARRLLAALPQSQPQPLCGVPCGSGSGAISPGFPAQPVAAAHQSTRGGSGSIPAELLLGAMRYLAVSLAPPQTTSSSSGGGGAWGAAPTVTVRPAGRSGCGRLRLPPSFDSPLTPSTLTLTSALWGSTPGVVISATGGDVAASSTTGHHGGRQGDCGTLSGVGSVPPSASGSLLAHSALAVLVSEAVACFGSVQHWHAWAVWLRASAAEQGPSPGDGGSGAPPLAVGPIHGLQVEPPAPWPRSSPTAPPGAAHGGGVAAAVSRALAHGLRLSPPSSSHGAKVDLELQVAELPAAPGAHTAAVLSGGLRLGSLAPLTSRRNAGSCSATGSPGASLSGAGAGGAPTFPHGVCIERPAYDYAAARAALQFALLYTRPEAAAAMAHVVAENDRLLATCVTAAGEGLTGAAEGARGSLGAGSSGSKAGPRRVPGDLTAAAAAAIPAFATLAMSSKPVRLEELERLQAAAQGAFATSLRDGWAAGCKNGVRLALGDVGKGHFNLRETDATSYGFSKLSRLLRCAHWRMESTLRSALVAAAGDFAGFIEHACAATVAVRASNSVTVTHAQAPRGVLSRRCPLFALEMAVATAEEGEEGWGGEPGAAAAAASSSDASSSPSDTTVTAAAAGDATPTSDSQLRARRRFAYSYAPEALCAAPLAMLDRALRSAAGIPQLERTVMDRLFWPSEPLIAPVHPAEPTIAALKSRMTAALARACRPLDVYLRTLEPYVPFLNLDIEAHVAGLRAQWLRPDGPDDSEEDGSQLGSPAPPGGSDGGAGSSNSGGGAGSLPARVTAFSFLPDARALITGHRRTAVDVLGSLPASVDLGLAQVSLAEVRTSLARKHAALADGVLRATAALVTDSAAEVLRAYDAIVRTLSLAPSDVEGLTALREFMSGVPDKVAALQGRLGELGDAWELLDECGFTLPRETSDQRWRAEGGAARVARRLVETSASLDLDAQRYALEMAAEQVAFAETLAALADEVGALGGSFTRLEQAPAALHAVTKLRTALEECDARARTFQAREVLFNKPASGYEAVSELRRAFEPYQALWETASGWRKGMAGWLSDPLVTLNAEAIERDVGTCGRAMAKSVKALERAAAAATPGGGGGFGGTAASGEVDGEGASQTPPLPPPVVTAAGPVGQQRLDGPLAVARAVRDEIEAFKPLLPLIVALRNPGMRTRHWVELSAAVGFEIAPELEPEPAAAGAAPPDSRGTAAATAVVEVLPGAAAAASAPGGTAPAPAQPLRTHWDLTRVLAVQLGDHLDAVTRVSERAGKEHQIELALDKMEAEWAGVPLTLLPYRDTGTFLLRGVDVLQALLDEHTQTTQAVSFSAFKKPFAERIDAWAATLSTASEVLDEWLRLQRAFLYLQPIFASEDIQRQLPVEFKRFAGADKTWRASMLAAKGAAPAASPPASSSTPVATGASAAAPTAAAAAALAAQPVDGVAALPMCANPKLRDRFAEANRLLELVQKGLSDYLSMKRGVMPRFFFLSDAELLEILSQARDPQAVQPHLRKCFEGVARVEFGGSPGAHATASSGGGAAAVIVSMQSAEKEVVPLTSPVDTRGKPVEAWLLEFERAMIAAVRAQMRDALQDYVVAPRPQWVQKWPGQCVIAGSQVYWTAAVESAIRACGAEAEADAAASAAAGDGERLGDSAALLLPPPSMAPLEAAYAAQLEQLREMVVLIRGRLSPLARITLGALTVIDVHARDVTRRLLDARITSTSDFLWTSQMRLYWKQAAAAGSQPDAVLIDEGGDLAARMVSAERAYAYEYIGNQPRLVITPLTDKCYLTLMGAMQMQLGGAPAGPAGTGKTETVKDLAKGLANYCVVFNCSDQMDVASTAKFFKGLVSCGAWACFDEFNRIDVEVLSVVAQQILCVQEACRAGKTRMVFEGTDIAVNMGYAAFITMNPGYAGRSELPDNLKALFRPCAMMVRSLLEWVRTGGYTQLRTCISSDINRPPAPAPPPPPPLLFLPQVPDYALISEISLFSYGYSAAQPLARKIVSLLKLCSEQLSSQDW